MGTSITELAEQLMDITRWQKTPELLTPEHYEHMILKAIKRLFIDTGRASEYSDGLIETISTDATADDGTVTTYTTTSFKKNFQIDEEAYILICAQIEFFRKVQSDVNNIVGYTTDALTVTNADKPYVNLKDTLGQLEQDRRITYYKMVRFCM